MLLWPPLLADRFAAAVWLAMQNTLWSRLLARNPHKHLLVEYVAKKRAGQFASVWDRIDTELYLTGALIFEWWVLKPSRTALPTMYHSKLCAAHAVAWPCKHHTPHVSTLPLDMG